MSGRAAVIAEAIAARSGRPDLLQHRVESLLKVIDSDAAFAAERNDEFHRGWASGARAALAWLSDVVVEVAS